MFVVVVVVAVVVCCLLLLLLMLLVLLSLLFVVAAAVAVRGRSSPHSIYNNSRSTAPAAVMFMRITMIMISPSNPLIVP